MRGLKVVIICVIIIIIILSAILLFVLNYEKMSKGIIETEKSYTELDLIENANVEKVTNKNDYYTVKYILNTYFEYINYANSNAADLEVTNFPEQQEIVEEYQNLGMEGLKNILDQNYLEEKTDEQIKINMTEYKNIVFRISDMYCQDKTVRRKVYFVYVILDYNKEVSIIVKIDSISNCFSIIPPDYIEENQFTEKKLDLIQVDEIVANTNNQYEYISVTDKMMANSYMEDYAELVLNNAQQAYEMLSEEYKKKRFPTWQEYENYIRTSEKDYKMLRLMSYKVNKKQNYTEYICEDQYGNRYIFEEKGVMDYTIQLDDYILENEVFNEKYKKADARDKAILNIDKFFQMLNMQDYTSAYKVLDESFKQNYFPTQQQFEEYMKSKIFRYNNVTYNTYIEPVTNLYSFNLTISDKTEQKQEKVDFNLVMQLREGTDFVMSFEVT